MNESLAHVRLQSRYDPHQPHGRQPFGDRQLRHSPSLGPRDFYDSDDDGMQLALQRGDTCGQRTI